MSSVIGDMLVRIAGDNSSFDKSVDQSKEKQDQFAASVSKSAKSIESSYGSISNVIKNGLASVSTSLRNIDSEMSVWGRSTDYIALKQQLLRQQITNLIQQGVDPLDASIEKLQVQYYDLGNETIALQKKQTGLTDTLSSISRVAGQVGLALSISVTAPLLAAAKAALTSVGAFQSYQASFETMLGSSGKATKMIATLQDMAAKTPFELSDLAGATKTLLQFNVAQNEVLPILKSLGDISQGNGQRFSALALAFGQATAAGRLMGQDLLQMINAGFNPLQEMTKLTGKSMAVLKKEMELGKISAEMLAEAFKSASGSGGKFFEGMDKASRTLPGLLSTLNDDIATMGRSFADIFIGPAMDAVKALSSLAQFITSLPAPVKAATIAVGAFAASLGPLALGISGVTKALTFFITSAGALTGTGTIALAIAGVVALTGAFIALNAAAKQQQVDKISADIANSLRTAVASGEKLADVIKRLSDTYGYSVTDIIKIARAQKLVTDENENTLDAIEKQNAARDKGKKDLASVDKLNKEIAETFDYAQRGIIDWVTNSKDLAEQVMDIANYYGVSATNVIGIIRNSKGLTEEQKIQLKVLQDQLDIQNKILESSVATESSRNYKAVSERTAAFNKELAVIKTNVMNLSTIATSADIQIVDSLLNQLRAMGSKEGGVNFDALLAVRKKYDAAVLKSAAIANEAQEQGNSRRAEQARFMAEETQIKAKLARGDLTKIQSETALIELYKNHVSVLEGLNFYNENFTSLIGNVTTKAEEGNSEWRKTVTLLKSLGFEYNALSQAQNIFNKQVELNNQKIVSGYSQEEDALAANAEAAQQYASAIEEAYGIASTEYKVAFEQLQKYKDLQDYSLVSYNKAISENQKLVDAQRKTSSVALQENISLTESLLSSWARAGKTGSKAYIDLEKSLNIMKNSTDILKDSTAAYEKELGVIAAKGASGVGLLTPEEQLTTTIALTEQLLDTWIRGGFKGTAEFKKMNDILQKMKVSLSPVSMAMDLYNKSISDNTRLVTLGFRTKQDGYQEELNAITKLIQTFALNGLTSGLVFNQYNAIYLALKKNIDSLSAAAEAYNTVISQNEQQASHNLITTEALLKNNIATTQTYKSKLEEYGKTGTDEYTRVSGSLTLLTKQYDLITTKALEYNNAIKANQNRTITETRKVISTNTAEEENPSITKTITTKVIVPNTDLNADILKENIRLTQAYLVELSNAGLANSTMFKKAAADLELMTGGTNALVNAEKEYRKQISDTAILLANHNISSEDAIKSNQAATDNLIRSMSLAGLTGDKLYTQLVKDLSSYNMQLMIASNYAQTAAGKKEDFEAQLKYWKDVAVAVQDDAKKLQEVQAIIDNLNANAPKEALSAFAQKVEDMYGSTESGAKEAASSLKKHFEDALKGNPFGLTEIQLQHLQIVIDSLNTEGISAAANSYNNVIVNAERRASEGLQTTQEMISKNIDSSNTYLTSLESLGQKGSLEYVKITKAVSDYKNQLLLLTSYTDTYNNTLKAHQDAVSSGELSQADATKAKIASTKTYMGVLLDAGLASTTEYEKAKYALDLLTGGTNTLTDATKEYAKQIKETETLLANQNISEADAIQAKITAIKTYMQALSLAGSVGTAEYGALAKELGKYSIQLKIATEFASTALGTKEAFDATMKGWLAIKEAVKADADQLARVQAIIDNLNANAPETAISKLKNTIKDMYASTEFGAKDAADALKKMLDSAMVPGNPFGLLPEELKKLQVILGSLKTDEISAAMEKYSTAISNNEKLASSALKTTRESLWANIAATNTYLNDLKALGQIGSAEYIKVQKSMELLNAQYDLLSGATQTYKDAVKSNTDAAKTGSLTQSEALNKNIASTKEFLIILSNAGLSGSDVYAKASADLDSMTGGTNTLLDAEKVYAKQIKDTSLLLEAKFIKHDEGVQANISSTKELMQVMALLGKSGSAEYQALKISLAQYNLELELLIAYNEALIKKDPLKPTIDALQNLIDLASKATDAKQIELFKTIETDKLKEVGSLLIKMYRDSKEGAGSSLKTQIEYFTRLSSSIGASTAQGKAYKAALDQVKPDAIKNIDEAFKTTDKGAEEANKQVSAYFESIQSAYNSGAIQLTEEELKKLGIVIDSLNKKELTIWDKLEVGFDKVLSLTQTVTSSLKELFDMIAQNAMDALDAQTEALLYANEQQLEALLEREGLKEKTEVESAQKTVDELKAQYAKEHSMRKKAAILEQIVEAEKALRKAQILADYAKKEKDINDAAALQRYQMQKAQFEADKRFSIAQTVIDTAQMAVQVYKSFAALGPIGIALGVAAAAAAAAFGAAKISIIQAQVPPAAPRLAEGGIVMPQKGGRTVTVAEAGVPEAIVPLDKLNSIIQKIVSTIVGNKDTTKKESSSIVNINNNQQTIDNKTIDNSFPGGLIADILADIRSILFKYQSTEKIPIINNVQTGENNQSILPTSNMLGTTFADLISRIIASNDMIYKNQIFSLNQLNNLISNFPTISAASSDPTIDLVVNIDSKPILSKIFQATKNKTVLISQGAVV